MIRFLVVSFEILVLIMVLRSDFVQFWLSDLQSKASQWMTEISSSLDNNQLEELRDTVKVQSLNLNEAQLDYLSDVTYSKVKLARFNQFYCVQGDKNPYLYGINLRLLCTEIQRTGLLNTRV